MKIDTTILLPIAAVVSSVWLLMAGKKRPMEIIALIASGVWLVIQLGLITWPLKSSIATAPMIIGATLLVCGVLVWLNTSNKREATASTVLAILGGVLIAHALAH
jgi:hypothetical protein